MSFSLAEIDRAIEWRVNDEMISRNLIPDKRAYIIANDTVGYNNAYKALSEKVKIFGVGNYTDREQLTANNIIINRLGIPDGDVGVGYPFFFTYNEAIGKYEKKEGAQGSYHIEYEIRFFCDNTTLERKLSEAMLVIFPRRTFLKGIVDETLKETDENFLITKPSTPVDMSTGKYIEKVMRILVNDVDITPEKIIEEVAPATDISVYVTPNIDNVDQLPIDWDGDTETAKIKVTVPEVSSQSIEPADASDILLNFNMNIAIENPADTLPFSVIKNDVDITESIVSIIKSTVTQLTITMSSAFVNGDIIAISYTREQEKAMVVSENSTEMEEIVNRNVANNL